MARRKRTQPVADEILYVPKRVFDESRVVIPNKSPAKKAPPKNRRVRKKPSRYVVEEPIVRPFGDYEGFEVRTALIRSRSYDPAKAPVISGAWKAAELCKHMAYYDQEHVVVVATNVSNRLLALFEAAIGTTSGAAMEAKHVIKVPLLTGASAAIVVHNHPSGSVDPSPDDFKTMDALEKAFDCVGVQMLDFLVVSTAGWTSCKFMETAPWR